MNYEFPPPIPMSLGIPAFVLQLLCLAILLATCFRVFAWREPMSKASRASRSGVALGLAILIGVVGLVMELNGSQLQPWLAFWLVLLAVITATIILRRARSRPESVTWTRIAFLITLLLPAAIVFQFQIRRGLNFGCENNLHNLSIAYSNCVGTRNGALPNKEFFDCSWRLSMLGFLEKSYDTEDYSIHYSWSSNANLKFAQLKKEQYQCPLNIFPTDEQGRYYADVARITGPGTAFPPEKSVLLTAIEKGDGLSQTLLLGECSGLNIVWTEPRDIDTAELKMGINLSGSKPRSSSSILSSYHRGGAYALFADGSIRFLSESIDPGVLRAMTTINGGEPIVAP